MHIKAGASDQQLHRVKSHDNIEKISFRVVLERDSGDGNTIKKAGITKRASRTVAVRVSSEYREIIPHFGGESTGPSLP